MFFFLSFKIWRWWYKYDGYFFFLLKSKMQMKKVDKFEDEDDKDNKN